MTNTNKTLHGLFEDVASEIPSATALIHVGKSFTYQQLNYQSNQLAHYIYSKINHETNPLVALFLDKGFEMIIAILGIWKSGAAYVPIDPSYPNDRINFILKDTNAKIVLTSSNLSSRLKALICNQEIIVIDELDLDLLPFQNLNLPSKTDSYAYIMYTSGSTGTPKGILKTHKSVGYCTEAISKEYKINKSSKEIIALFSNYVYEPFLRQLLVAFLNGQKLVIVCDEIKRDPKEFTNFLTQNNVTFLNGTASMLQEYNFSYCKNLKKLVFAGEELTENCYKHVRKTFNGEIINEYGPTECTFVSCLKIYQSHEKRDNQSIGKPIENVKCYILDENMMELPSGVIGELYISGIGVAEGYFNLPKQTAERFCKNLFQTEIEKVQGIYHRIYKTGDLAKWLPNGELEFFGRNDFQIKINGIRIEPGEIENTLLKHPSIEKAIIVSNLALKLKSDEKFLIGFYIAKENITEEILKTFFLSKLPVYMVPKRLIEINEIPISVNGKIDLTAICEIYQNAVNFSLKNTEGDNEFEQVLMEILSNLLQLPSNFIDYEKDIFQLGADSITVIRLISEIRERMNIELTVTQIYENSNIQMLTRLCKSCQNGICNSKFESEAVKSDNILPANNMQQRFLYNHMKTNDDTYIIQYKCEYKTKLNSNIYKKSWKLAQTKFPALRLKFVIKKDEIYQIINQKQKLIWKFIDLSNSKDSLKESKIIQENDRKKPYDLEAGSLFRIYLLKINEFKFQLIFSCHHIILDGWSLSILFNFVHDSYLKVFNGEIVSVVEDFAYKNAQTFLSQKTAESLRNNNYLEDQIERPDLNGLLKDDKKNKINISQRNHIICQKEVLITIKSELYAKSGEKLKLYGITYNSFLQYCWTKLLCIYGNCKNITLGTVVSGRNIPLQNVVNSVGLYITTLPLKINFEELDNLKLCDAIKHLQTKVFEINDDSNDSKKHEFDSMFVFENYQSLKNAKDLTESEKELKFKVLSTHEKLDFPLTLIVRTPEDGLQIKINFDEDIFEQKVMKQLLENMEEMIHHLSNNLNSTISDFEILCFREQKILNAWNEESKIEYPLNQTLHGIFENKVDENSQKNAVVFENDELTYEKLNKNANQLAHHLQNTNLIKPNAIIALFLDKNPLMITAILGTWKSGAAYVPIDPSYPNDRINFIIKDTNAKIIITNKCHISKLFIPSEILIIEAEEYCVGNLSSTNCDENLLHMSESRDLAYVIYTSGTTGNPKGVMVEHIGVANLCCALRDIFHLQDETRETILSFSNYVFDHFIEQMLDALLNGQTLLILNDEMRVDKKRLYNYIEKNHVTYLSGTPSVLKMYDYDEFNSSSLKRIDAVGEDFSETVFNEIRRMFKGLIINGYGPTEVSITTHKRLYYLNDKRSNKSIGKQIANISSYVLDENLHRIPIGAIGELYLGGIGVARGYLNRPDLTAERFLSNPFQTEKEKIKKENERIYKTGDLVRFLSNGEVEYLGRNDFQVKINGSRVELGEIETALSLYPKIKQCIVIAKDITAKSFLPSSKKYLIGYYISDTKICEQNVKAFLRSKLPSHMIPNRICQIQKIPVTISGKLNIKSLPDIEYSANSDTFISPKNDLQKKLCKIWSEILEISAEEIGIEDDFFNLGGDSIMSVKLYFTLSHEFSIIVNSSIFQLRTIKSMAEYIQENNQNVLTSKQFIPQNKKEESCLSFAQERLLFIEEYEGGTNAYNVCMHYGIKGDIDIGILKEAFLKVIERQEVLRTIIIKNPENQQFFQKVLNFEISNEMFEINKINVENEFELKTEMENAANYHFNLQKDLPIQVSCYFINQHFTHLTINIHHIYFDKWSQDILERELEYFYKFTSLKLKNSDLPQLDISYRDYAIWQRNAMNDDEKINNQMKFWRKKLEYSEALNLPLDYKRPTNFDYQAGSEIYFELEEETTDLIKELAKELKVTLYSILMGTYCMMLSNFSHQQSIIIGTAVTTRTKPELENLIGLFVNMLPLNIRENPTQKLVNYFQMVNNEIVEAQNYQEIPFEKLVKEFSEEKNLNQHPIFQVVFNMENKRKSNSETDENLLTPFNPYNPISNVTTTKYDLLTSIRNTHPNIQGYFNYYTKIFHHSTIENMIETYKFMLLQLAQNMKNGNIFNMENGSLKLINPVQQQLLSSMKNESYQETTATEITLNQIFDKTVEKYPNKIAIDYGSCSLTYAELQKTANCLACCLQKTNLIQPNSIIALFLNKNPLMITAILGIWKSGAAYVPIDPSYPNDRINFILKDTNSKIIITNKCHISKLNEFIPSEILIIEAEEFAFENLHEYSSIVLQNANITAGNLAYVIYTSGSTSHPKGVLVEHRSVISFYNDITQRYFKYSPDEEGILFLSNYAFDFSIEQFILSFLFGKTLIIVPENIPICSNDFYNYLNQRRVTYISGTPSQLQLINFKKLTTLKQVTVAGEVFQKYHFEHIRQSFEGLLRNAYGTTETTVYNFIQTFTKNDEFVNSLGKPLNNTKMYVLNESLEEVPPNAIGKLYLTGECVTQGYLNRSNENEKSFIFNKFKGKDQSCNILYNTGDLVRWNKNGNLEYIGRNDLQVKINGLRIDLSEIKNTVLNFEKIQQCAVTVNDSDKNSNQKQINVYYVSKNNQKVNDKILFNFLSSQLPTFMIPKQIIQIYDHLPLTSNGKLDERALPKSDSVEPYKNGIAFTPPSNYLEEKLCQIWADLLNLEIVGINDDFFALGGDSILVMQLAEQIYNELQITISLKDIFVHRSIKNLAAVLQIQKYETKKEVKVEKVKNGKSDLFPLLPIQKWFFAKNLKNLNHWNQTFTIKISKELNSEKLQKALIKLFKLHEAFRIRFKKTESEHFLYYTSMDTVESFKLNCLSVKKLGIQKVNEIIKNSQMNLNIYDGPLFFVYYLHEFEENETVKIIFSMHHLIVDVVSWRIICRDLERIYNGDEIIRPSMTSYSEWVDTVNDHYLNSEMENEKQWWKELIEKSEKFNDFILKNFNLEKEYQKYNFSISSEQTECLLRYSIQKLQIKNVSIILLAALGRSLHFLTEQKQNYITLEGHGREGDGLKVSNIHNTVGWFTTMYPFEFLAADNGDLKEEIENIKNFETNIPNNGLGFGCLFGYENLPRICFNYLGQLDKSKKVDNTSSWGIEDIDKDYKSRNDSTHSSISSDKNVIDFCAFVENGRMEFRLSSKLEDLKNEKFIKDFKKSVDEIVFLIENKNPKHAPIFKPYLEFHKEQQSTIFVLPPGEGGAESYARIIHKFSNFHMILFNNYYLFHKQNESEENEITFESLAKFYIKYIKSLKPKGPYTFIGWSFGGILAFEITRQLIVDGESVDNLIIIDSYFNVSLALQSSIGKIDKTVVDKINILYSPNKIDFENVVPKIKNITLFRATKLNTMYKNENEKKFYEFYKNSEFNNLDTIINPDLIKVINMNGDTHLSWIFNENSTDFLADYITKIVEKFL